MTEARVRLLGHSVHQMLVPMTIGLLVGTAGLDIWQLLQPTPGRAEVTYVLLAATLVTGLIAAVVGWIDWSGIPTGTRARSVGLAHGAGNVLLLALLGISWALRRENPTMPPTPALWLVIVSAAVGAVTAWLGGELVARLGIGVSPGANPNAPSSLQTP